MTRSRRLRWAMAATVVSTLAIAVAPQGTAQAAASHDAARAMPQGVAVQGVAVQGVESSVTFSRPASAVDGAGAARGSTIARPQQDARATQTGGVIVRFKSGTAPATSSAGRDRVLDAVAAEHHTELEPARALATGATLVEGATPQEADEVAATLLARPDVAYAEPDVRLRTSSATNDPLADYQWDLTAAPEGIGAEEVWPVAQGAGVTVAVVDSGIVAHPELSGRVLRGHDFISDAASARDGGGRDQDPRDMGDWQRSGECPGSAKAADSSWHGTHVAGTIAAASDNAIGVAGIAPKASILPVRVMGRCGGTLSDIADGLTWASGGKVAGVPANRNPAKVVNLSVGAKEACPATLQSAITAAGARGAIIVTAAGNAGGDAAQDTPGNCRGVVNVAATAGAGGRAPYSNHGPAVTIAAPGGSGTDDAILSTIDAGTRSATGADYGFMIGTSMAAPHVSGVAALLLGLDRSLSPAKLRQLLVSTAKPFPASCSGCGSGIVDAVAAVNAVRPQAVPGGAP